MKRRAVKPATPTVVASHMNPYIPPSVPLRPGSMRASELPSRIGDQYIYPRRSVRRSQI